MRIRTCVVATLLAVSCGGSSSDPDGVPTELTGSMVTFGSAYGIDLADVNDDGRLDLVRTMNLRVQDGFTTRDHNMIEVWLRQP